MMARAGLPRTASEGATPTIADCIARYGSATVKAALRERAALTRWLATPRPWAVYRAAVNAVVSSGTDADVLIEAFTEPVRRCLVLGAISSDFMLDAVRLNAHAALAPKRKK